MPGTTACLISMGKMLQCNYRVTGDVGGKSLEGTNMGVHPRRLGLAGLGELRGLERRSALEGSRSRESREGVRNTAKCAGNAQLESLRVA